MTDLLLVVGAIHSQGALITIPGAVQRVQRLQDDGAAGEQGEPAAAVAGGGRAQQGAAAAAGQGQRPTGRQQGQGREQPPAEVRMTTCHSHSFFFFFSSFLFF